MDVAARLAEFAVQARPSDAALSGMARSLFDWSACALAGAQEPVAGILRAQAEAEGGVPQASMIGSVAMMVPARAAALVNGTTGHALDYDDTHFGNLGHPSTVAIPAALAVAERQNADGTAFLRAALIGAEAAVRVGQWLGRSHYEAGFHQTATAGALGAALGAGALIGLDADRMAHALAIAATQAAGLKTQFGTMGKPLHAGRAAATGVEAADLSAAGFIANPAGLTGAAGFAKAHAGEEGEGAFLGMGARWEMERVSYKFHACCHGLHAALEALSHVRLAPGSVDRLTVRVHPRWLAVCNIAAPQTGLEAKFSYRMAAALALSGRDTGALSTWSDAACQEPELIALRDKVDVLGDPRISESVAEIALTASGGRSHELKADIAEPAHGVPDGAMLEARLRRKAVSLLGASAAEELAAEVLRPDPDIEALCARLRRADPPV